MRQSPPPSLKVQEASGLDSALVRGREARIAAWNVRELSVEEAERGKCFCYTSLM